MSHFDDVDVVAYGAPGGVLGLLIVLACIGWAIWADGKSADVCAKHGEAYVDSRTGYTLCEQDGGAVVRRHD